MGFLRLSSVLHAQVIFPQILRVPADYPTIQKAIAAAVSGINDTVSVSNGVYFENLDFKGNAVILKSVNGPQVTTFDGGWAGPVVTFNNGEGPGSMVEGFAIQNG